MGFLIYTILVGILHVTISNGQNFKPNIWSVDTAICSISPLPHGTYTASRGVHCLVEDCNDCAPTNNVSGITFFHNNPTTNNDVMSMWNLGNKKPSSINQEPATLEQANPDTIVPDTTTTYQLYPGLGTKNKPIVTYPDTGTDYSNTPDIGNNNNLPISYPEIGNNNSPIPYPDIAGNNAPSLYPAMGNNNNGDITYPDISANNNAPGLYTAIGTNNNNAGISYPSISTSNEEISYPGMDGNTHISYPEIGTSSNNNAPISYPVIEVNNNAPVTYPDIANNNNAPLPYPDIAVSNNNVQTLYPDINNNKPISYPDISSTNNAPTAYLDIETNNTPIPHPDIGANTFGDAGSGIPTVSMNAAPSGNNFGADAVVLDTQSMDLSQLGIIDGSVPMNPITSVTNGNGNFRSTSGISTWKESNSRTNSNSGLNHGLLKTFKSEKTTYNQIPLDPFRGARIEQTLNRITPLSTNSRIAAIRNSNNARGFSTVNTQRSDKYMGFRIKTQFDDHTKKALMRPKHKFIDMSESGIKASGGFIDLSKVTVTKDQPQFAAGIALPGVLSGSKDGLSNLGTFVDLSNTGNSVNGETQGIPGNSENDLPKNGINRSNLAFIVPGNNVNKDSLYQDVESTGGNQRNPTAIGNSGRTGETVIGTITDMSGTGNGVIGTVPVGENVIGGRLNNVPNTNNGNTVILPVGSNAGGNKNENRVFIDNGGIKIPTDTSINSNGIGTPVENTDRLLIDNGAMVPPASVKPNNILVNNNEGMFSGDSGIKTAPTSSILNNGDSTNLVSTSAGSNTSPSTNNGGRFPEANSRPAGNGIGSVLVDNTNILPPINTNPNSQPTFNGGRMVVIDNNGRTMPSFNSGQTTNFNGMNAGISNPMNERSNIHGMPFVNSNSIVDATNQLNNMNGQMKQNPVFGTNSNTGRMPNLQQTQFQNGQSMINQPPISGFVRVSGPNGPILVPRPGSINGNIPNNQILHSNFINLPNSLQNGPQFTSRTGIPFSNMNAMPAPNGQIPRNQINTNPQQGAHTRANSFNTPQNGMNQITGFGNGAQNNQGFLNGIDSQTNSMNTNRMGIHTGIVPNIKRAGTLNTMNGQNIQSPIGFPSNQRLPTTQNGLNRQANLNAMNNPNNQNLPNGAPISNRQNIPANFPTNGQQPIISNRQTIPAVGNFPNNQVPISQNGVNFQNVPTNLQGLNRQANLNAMNNPNNKNLPNGAPISNRQNIPANFPTNGQQNRQMIPAFGNFPNNQVPISQNGVNFQNVPTNLQGLNRQANLNAMNTPNNKNLPNGAPISNRQNIPTNFPNNGQQPIISNRQTIPAVGNFPNNQVPNSQIGVNFQNVPTNLQGLNRQANLNAMNTPNNQNLPNGATISNRQNIPTNFPTNGQRPIISNRQTIPGVGNFPNNQFPNSQNGVNFQNVPTNLQGLNRKANLNAMNTPNNKNLPNGAPISNRQNIPANFPTNGQQTVISNRQTIPGVGSFPNNQFPISQNGVNFQNVPTNLQNRNNQMTRTTFPIDPNSIQTGQTRMSGINNRPVGASIQEQQFMNRFQNQNPFVRPMVRNGGQLSQFGPGNGPAFPGQPQFGIPMNQQMMPSGNFNQFPPNNFPMLNMPFK